MTVHSLPPVDGAASVVQRSRFGRWKMLGVLFVCAAPVVASYFTYYVLRPEGRRNYGELVNPQRALPDVMATAQDGQSVPLNSLKGQWLLVSVAPAACYAVCQQHLYFQRQLRESLGKEKDRLDRVWLVSDSAEIPPQIGPGLAQSTVLRVDAGVLADWLQPAAGHQLTEHLYVVDPLGHWMMRFPAAMDAAGAAKAKKDLERLLRASSSWDGAGRSEKL